MASNLSNAYFALVISAGDASKLPMVHASLTRLRRKIEIALNLLSVDSTNSSSSTKTRGANGRNAAAAAAAAASRDTSTVFSYASLETISACENACRIIGDVEILLSNALSLLHKFPKQVDLVENLLRHSHSEATVHVDEGARLDTLELLVAQHRHPVLREYLFRNTDETLPCQLSVRCGGSGNGDNHDDEEEEKLSRKFGGLLVALTRTESLI
jgi:hypothetical protein